MIIQTAKQGWRIMDSVTGWKLAFDCSARVSNAARKAQPEEAPWQTAVADAGGLAARRDAHGVVQEVEIRLFEAIGAVEVYHRIRNTTAATTWIDSIRTVDGELEAGRPLAAPAYLHSLNTFPDLRTDVPADLPPLCPLKKNTPSILLGRVPHPFFEGLAVWQGAEAPCVVTGALTQRIVHRSQQLVWDGARCVRLKTEQDLRGIDRKALEPGKALELDGVFVQFRRNGDLNEAFTDYLGALRQANGTRWEKNPLRKEFFFCSWNNYLYWDQAADELLHTAREIKRHFPKVAWLCVDSGYENSTANPYPALTKLPNGELSFDHAVEMLWSSHQPGVTFAFAGSSGEDRRKFPEGLLGFAKRTHAMGIKPAIWLGMQVSRHSPCFQQHPELFHAHQIGDWRFLDVSIPEVRQQIEQVFKTYFGRGKFEAIKLDFWTHLFESPNLKFRNQDKTAAEWRQWFFEMLRSCLPEDGFISLGCTLAMGAPFLAPWVDSYRHSDDMRDGYWEVVKTCVRWAVVPVLTHGFGQPIADADTLSLYKGLSRDELECWANFACITGSVVELGGNPIRWDADGVRWLRRYLDHPCAGERVWIGDADSWGRDGLPRVFYREETIGAGGSYLVSLHNWSDAPATLSPDDWVGPIRGCSSYEEAGAGQCGKLQGAAFQLPPRSSKLLRVIDAKEECP